MIALIITFCAITFQAARLLVYQAAWLRDQGRPFSKQAAMAKLFASEIGEKICRDAIQVFGGYGYTREYPISRFYTDARIQRIYGGTSEIMRELVARSILGR